MRLIGLISTLVAVVHGGRYKAPDPSQVIFNYTRIPTMTELIADAGYEHDQHRVITLDGHILAVHRITPRGTKSEHRGYPVLIVNGFGFQAEGFLALGSASLPFILTDLGYDVWIGDQRGSIRSVQHETFALSDFRNHNYTFHEQGFYDMPAFIDFVLGKTGRQKLLYVGYSLSSGMLIVLNSERPEYNEKLLGVVLMAPAGHLRKWEQNPPNYITGISTVDSQIESQIRMGLWLFMGNYQFIKETLLKCTISMTNPICRSLIYNMYGVSVSSDPKILFYQFAMTVTSVSVFVGRHLMQVIKNGRFCRYDMGAEKNFAIYGQIVPPNYYLNNTRVPIFLFHGGLDNMVTIDAAERTIRGLGNVVKKKLVRRYNHADFLFAQNAPKKIYEDVVEYFDELVGGTLE